ncbi:hypothetical protein FHG87_007232 [Trinorchestia longiramus]|nr:hypothetical protein FHG87_007232 [Trinorchestia longiramus]
MGGKIQRTRPVLLIVLVLQSISPACTGMGVAKPGLYLNDIKELCTGACSTNNHYDVSTEKCHVTISNKIANELPMYSCNLANKTDSYLLKIHKSLASQKLYKCLRIENAGLVELMATAIADSLEFINVKSITTEVESSGNELFRSLTLTNTTISEVTFSGLKILKLNNSKVNLVDLPDLQEIDIVGRSVVNELRARIQEPRSTFHDSTIGELSYIEVGSSAILNVSNMAIKAIRNMTVLENAQLTISLSQINEIYNLEILTNNATIDHVVVGEIPEKSIQISGKLVASDSVFKNAQKDGILIKQTGRISFKNVSINSLLTSYILEGVDEDLNSTLSVLYLNSAQPQSVYFWFTVVLLIILLLVGAVIVFLFCKKNATRSFSNDLHRSYNSKQCSNGSCSNDYMPPSQKEKIPKTENAEIIQMGDKEGTKDEPSHPISPPSISLSHVSAANEITPSYPPPPPKQGSVPDDHDLLVYVDADSQPLPPPPPPSLPPLPGHTVSPEKSFVHQASKNFSNNTAPGEPYSQQTSSAGPPLQKPTLPQKPPSVNPLLFSNKFKPTNNRLNEDHPLPPPVDSLPPSSHYAGRSKPKPPPRRGSAVTTPSPASNSFDPSTAESNEPPLYEDTALEEPLYASEDELGQY